MLTRSQWLEAGPKFLQALRSYDFTEVDEAKPI